MVDTSKQNTYRDKKREGLKDVKSTNPLYNTFMAIKSVSDSYAKATKKKKKD